METGREKIEAALSGEGTPELPAVIPYEMIFIRDHWNSLTERPWWTVNDPDPAVQAAWRSEIAAKTGQDWIRLPGSEPRDERKHKKIAVRPSGVFLADLSRGTEKMLHAPAVSGWNPGKVYSDSKKKSVSGRDAVDALVPAPDAGELDRFSCEGRDDAALLIRKGAAGGLFRIIHVTSPLWACYGYGLWSFDGLMEAVARDSELLEYACGKCLEAAAHSVRKGRLLGAEGVWIEECLTDMLSPSSFEKFNLPGLRSLCEEINAQGMKSIYYYCGNPYGKMEFIEDSGADAISFEESRKGFDMDMRKIAKYMRGRKTLLGNIDAYGCLEKGGEKDLKEEIIRQADAGRLNRRRFIMSLGSPVTPETPAEKVRLYCDLTHGLPAVPGV